ncbi:hypothetical protein [Thermomonospora curvata]|uniref:hypothetical protein n=1 Tax=Thermomonospora curvata TaxID=2020 RepID=UPI0011D19A41|nr:hypothetical protein [Thermomonospora curvata]
MSWQVTGPGTGTGTDDPFAAAETQVRAMAAAPWWNTAPPQQRAEAIASRMLTGAGEWWLFGAWARWYRCGLDGTWQPCPPPLDPAVRRRTTTAPRGAGNPPIPPQLVPAGPDLNAGRITSAGFVGPLPDPATVAALQQAQIEALGVNVAQFTLADPTFTPGTPSTLAAAWSALLWCAGAPVALGDHPMIQLFAPYLTTPPERLRWMSPPDFGTLVALYAGPLSAGDWSGASFIVRLLHKVAIALRGDERFRPGADALAAITAASLPMVQQDAATLRYGLPALVEQWRRRCPAEFALPLLRDASPGEFFRLGLYDLQQLVTRLHGRPLDHNEVRRIAMALLAADLHAAPAAAHALLPWLDPDSARTLQAVLSDASHPGRQWWPHNGRLPERLRGEDTALHALLATSYILGLTWCRLAQSPPPPTGFALAVAAAGALTEAARPPSTGELTPWQIIEAARAHLAANPGPLAAPPPRDDPPPAQPQPHDSTPPPTVAAPDSAQAAPPTVQAPAPASPVDLAQVAGDVPIAEAYGIRFVSGDEDIERLITEVRRRGKWAQRLRGQEVSSASMPALLLVGAPSSGQRRLGRMVARALADVNVSSGQMHSVHADELRPGGPQALQAALSRHSGHVLLLEGLDELLLEEPHGPACAAALYRARAEGVSDTTLLATCAPDRLQPLSQAAPELIADLRVVHLPDLSQPHLQRALLALLAGERRLRLDETAWQVVTADLPTLRGRGRLTGARLVETYLERAATRHLGRAVATQAIGSAQELVLTADDFHGLAAELSPP